MEMVVGLGLSSVGILLVFYLYLLVKPQSIKRQSFFLLGVLAVLLAILGQLFYSFAARWSTILGGVFGGVGALVAFLCAVLACYGGKLPVGIPGAQPAAKEEQAS